MKVPNNWKPPIPICDYIYDMCGGIWINRNTLFVIQLSFGYYLLPVTLREEHYNESADKFKFNCLRVWTGMRYTQIAEWINYLIHRQLIERQSI